MLEIKELKKFDFSLYNYSMQLYGICNFIDNLFI